MTRLHTRYTVVLAALFCFFQNVSAQSSEAASLVSSGDAYCRGYSFSEAVSAYQKAIAAATDTTDKIKIGEKLLKAQNGLSMTGFCSKPTVIARRRFSLEDFFLYYPLEDKSWRAVPNQLDSVGGNRFEKAIYFPPESRHLYYSAPDEDGIRNMYQTHYQDSVWSAPELINEQITTTSDEIFPLVSLDGKYLYFSSEGLYGMGGYDIYVSRWNEENGDWDVPENLGFPYSSPYDDFLFMNTPDGNYSIFASNRDCPPDSVNIYVLEYDGMPVRKAITDPDELKALSALDPPADPSKMENGHAVSNKLQENDQTRLYMVKMNEIRALRDSLTAYGKALDEERANLSSATDREAAMASIVRKESALPAFNDSLARASAALQQIEMDFLMKGVIIDPTKLDDDADREVLGLSSGYVFTRNNLGPSFKIDILKPKSNFDYTFMILPEGRFAEDNTIPDGLVYQIQLFTSSQKPTVARLKGLSPVFERKGGSGTFVYSAGLFRNYKSALSNLNKVRSRGFKSAYITAFKDGKNISVSQAKALEAKIKTIWSVKIYPDNGKDLPEIAVSAIRQQTSKDLIKTMDSGAVVFIAGPFDNPEDAQALVVSLKAVGVGNTAVINTTE